MTKALSPGPPWPDGAKSSRDSEESIVMRCPVECNGGGATSGKADAEKTAGRGRRTLGREAPRHCVPLGLRLADGRPADREAGPGAHLEDPPQPFGAEVGMRAALQDRPQCLAER